MSQPHDAFMVMPSDDDVRSSFGFDEADEQWLDRVKQAQVVDALGRFGPYELFEEVGRGGQGSVYRARQPGTHRIIAIKRLSAGSFATPTMRARFEREVEAASALAHPNIVRVYGTECIEGQQILAMEWINGVSIDRWAMARVQEYADPHTLRKLLDLFAVVCDAVSHAHQRGVLHRDLKPSNILVDANDQPHVLDFGLATFEVNIASASAITHGSGFLGTPAYASPEHVAGQSRQIDARSDVYALGVILYQILTGSLPFNEDASIAELFDSIRHDAPVRPSVRAANARRLPICREIDAIVMKAIEKDSKHRYQSVDAFGADVRRYLNNETVLAHPPSAAYQARKFIARHRAVFVAGVVVLLTLIAALAGITTALVHTQAAQEQTRKAEQTARQVNAFLNEMLATADPTIIRGYNVPVSELLDEAVKKLDAGALHDQPVAEARVRTSIAQAYQSLGLYPPARMQFEAALACGDVAGAGKEGRIEVADTMVKFAEVLRRDEAFQQALAMLEHAERIYLQHLGPANEQTMRARLKKYMNLLNLGDAAGRNAICTLLQDATRFTGSESNDLVLEIKSDLAFIGGCNNDAAQSLRMLEEILQVQRQRYGKDDERSARTLINLGAWNYNLGRFEQAEAYVTQALELRRKVYGEDHPAIASALYNLGNIVRRTNGFEAAAESYRKALEIQERRLVPAHYETARSRYRLAHALLRLDQTEEAEALFRQAMDDFATKPQAHIAVRQIWAARYVAQCLIVQKEFAEAEAILLQAMDIARIKFASTDEPGNVAASLVQLYETWGRHDEANSWRE